MLRFLLITAITLVGLNAQIKEEKEYFRNILVKDCKKLESGKFECSKFNKRGIQYEFATYDEKGRLKDGPYIKYHDEYIYKTLCKENCEDKKIISEKGEYKKGARVGVWEFYSKNGKLFKKEDFTRAKDREDHLEKMKKERYKEQVTFKGKQVESQKEKSKLPPKKLENNINQNKLDNNTNLK